MADPKIVRNLQAYFYKRPQDQTRAQVFAHIEKVHSQFRLTPANWDHAGGKRSSRGKTRARIGFTRRRLTGPRR